MAISCICYVDLAYNHRKPSSDDGLSQLELTGNKDVHHYYYFIHLFFNLLCKR